MLRLNIIKETGASTEFWHIPFAVKIKIINIFDARSKTYMLSSQRSICHKGYKSAERTMDNFTEEEFKFIDFFKMLCKYD